MPETDINIPPEVWPLIDLMFLITIAITALWLATTVFVLWRRQASNLTAAHDESPNRKAEPDFLSVDTKARKEALKRADAFERDLDKRDEAEARDERRASRRKDTPLQRLTRLVAFLMALFSLATMISGTIFQVSIMGAYWEQYSASERLMTVVRDHPIGVTITVIVIVYNIVRFVMNRSWQED